MLTSCPGPWLSPRVKAVTCLVTGPWPPNPPESLVVAIKLLNPPGLCVTQDGYTATARIRELEAEFMHGPLASPTGPAHAAEDADVNGRKRDGGAPKHSHRPWRNATAAAVRKSGELEKVAPGVTVENLHPWYSRVPIIALTAGKTAVVFSIPPTLFCLSISSFLSLFPPSFLQGAYSSRRSRKIGCVLLLLLLLCQRAFACTGFIDRSVHPSIFCCWLHKSCAKLRDVALSVSSYFTRRPRLQM